MTDMMPAQHVEITVTGDCGHVLGTWTDTIADKYPFYCEECDLDKRAGKYPWTLTTRITGGGGCPAVSPDGDACTVTDPGHRWHYGPDKGAGVRRMWADETPEERADRETERDEIWERLADAEERLGALEEHESTERALVWLVFDLVCEANPDGELARTFKARREAQQAAAAGEDAAATAG